MGRYRRVPSRLRPDARRAVGFPMRPASIMLRPMPRPKQPDHLAAMTEVSAKLEADVRRLALALLHQELERIRAMPLTEPARVTPRSAPVTAPPPAPTAKPARAPRRTTPKATDTVPALAPSAASTTPVPVIPAPPAPEAATAAPTVSEPPEAPNTTVTVPEPAAPEAPVSAPPSSGNEAVDEWRDRARHRREERALLREERHDRARRRRHEAETRTSAADVPRG
jgi:hypothetical protein